MCKTCARRKIGLSIYPIFENFLERILLFIRSLPSVSSSLRHRTKYRGGQDSRPRNESSLLFELFANSVKPDTP